MSIIRVEHLQKAFGDVMPIKDISFELNKGDVISIIGPSGTGKSTLLRCLNMLEKPTGGKIYFHDECITEPGYNLSNLRSKVGMVFQSFNLFGHKNVIDNIVMAPIDILGYTKEQAYVVAEKRMEEVGLISKRDSYPDQLSGGQKQRIAIARCLAMEPEVILFDEPTSALDPAMVKEVEGIIKKLVDQGKTMMIVTHEMDFAKSVANRVFYLDEGTIYEEGTPEEVFDHPKKEKTQVFMKNTKNMDYNFDTADFDTDDLHTMLTEYGKQNGIPQETIHLLEMLLEKKIVEFITMCVEEIKKGNLVVEYNEVEGVLKTTLYLNGEEKETLQLDKESVKMIEAYWKQIEEE